MQQRAILGGEKELYRGASPSGMVYPSTVATPFLMVMHHHGAADRAFLVGRGIRLAYIAHLLLSV